MVVDQLIDSYTCNTVMNLPELDQNQANDDSIRTILAQFWHITIRLQGHWKLSVISC